MALRKKAAAEKIPNLFSSVAAARSNVKKREVEILSFSYVKVYRTRRKIKNFELNVGCRFGKPSVPERRGTRTDSE